MTTDEDEFWTSAMDEWACRNPILRKFKKHKPDQGDVRRGKKKPSRATRK